MITFTGCSVLQPEAEREREKREREREKLELDVYVIFVGWKGRVIISNSVRSNESRIRLIIIESSKRGPLDRGHSAILDRNPPPISSRVVPAVAREF